ncbi:uncharacterized protein LOC118513017 isoform X2 [Anopheles stephensi]|uniref:uncharacterized protein LOC118513017 isoform X2 n=1 Tax=Anopheles stephensi TaxID=30069 RepID=UPI001658A67C|nr:uncharacterized protein LOC118513017 isoform X2 [Anopheles stephensi]
MKLIERMNGIGREVRQDSLDLSLETYHSEVYRGVSFFTLTNSGRIVCCPPTHVTKTNQSHRSMIMNKTLVGRSTVASKIKPSNQCLLNRACVSPKLHFVRNRLDVFFASQQTRQTRTRMPSTIAYCLTFVMTYVLLVKARPATERDNNLEHFEITSDQNDQSFSYKTTDNQWRDETVEINPKTGTLVISGWYRYTGPDGVIYQVKYVADENGYRPLGAHLPGADLSDPNAFSVFTPLVDTGISRTVLLSLVG